MKTKLSLTMLVMLILSLLASCRGSAKKTDTPVPTSTPSPTETPALKSHTQLVKVRDDYTVLLDCQGEGEPTIILEDSLGRKDWISTLMFRKISRTCTYSHYGMNGETVTELRTVGDQVQDLHSLLTQAGISGPYVLVGHGTSGFNIVLYASQYSADVAGLICVDCYTPQLYENQLKALGEKYNDVWDPSDGLRYEIKWAIEMFSANNLERVDILLSETQVKLVTSLGDIPFIVLVSGKPMIVGQQLDIPDIFYTLGLDKIYYTQSEAFSKLSSRGRVETFPDIEEIRMLQSDNVTKAVQEIVDAARQKP